MTKPPKFKKRYVLAEGWPVDLNGRIGLWKFPHRSRSLTLAELNIPDEVNGEDCPKYRLVLERVK